jgi:putative peptide zinc metalloprotease protein
MPQTNRHWFIIYAIASKLYSWFILFGILMFLYTVLKPYGLQSIGQSFAVFSVIGILTQMVINGYQILSTPRENPIQKWRLAVTGIVLAIVITCLGMIEIPIIQWAAFVIEPQDVHHVVTKVAGELVELDVKQGDLVEAGQRLAVLHDPRLDDMKRELSMQKELKEKALHYARVIDSPGEQLLAEEALQSVNEQLTELNEQMKNLVVVAPISGMVIAPPRQPTPKIEQMRTRLVGWTGTPLDKKNKNAYLEDRTKLLSIAPTNGMQAILYLDQSDRHDVWVGMKVGLKFDHLPERVFRGTISQIASAHSDYAPETMAVKNGGLLATTSDKEGREQLQESAYQATVQLDDSPELMRSNLRGTARFMAANRSAFGWLWRYIRRTFHFKM